MPFRSQIKQYDKKLVVLHLSNGQHFSGYLDSSGDGTFFEFQPDGQGEPRRLINTDHVVSIHIAAAATARAGESKRV